MKIRLLILLLLCCGAAYADDGKDVSADKKSNKQDDTIWLEKKISPTTRWLDNLVKPLTVWMEQQINEPEPASELEKPRGAQVGSVDLNLSETDSANGVMSVPLVSSDQARVVAKKHIAGDVLYIKFMQQSNRYRVKLISKVGEIHIIYINAASGDIVSPNDKVPIGPVEANTPEDIINTDSLPLIIPDTGNGGEP